MIVFSGDTMEHQGTSQVGIGELGGSGTSSHHVKEQDTVRTVCSLELAQGGVAYVVLG